MNVFENWSSSWKKLDLDHISEPKDGRVALKPRGVPSRKTRDNACHLLIRMVIPIVDRGKTANGPLLYDLTVGYHVEYVELCI